MAKNWIPLRQVEGTASRQAHVRLPEGTYEREISKEGFFGPSAQFHHRHKPTDWVDFDGPIRPRALDLTKLATPQTNPWQAPLGMGNPHLHMRNWKVSVKRRNTLSTVTYPFNPLDVVGWHGDLSVVRINWRDLRPLMSHRAHLPPSAHTTFMAGRFVVCTFVPRPFESDPEALKLPFFHNNDDYEEIIFYHKGSFF